MAIITHLEYHPRGSEKLIQRVRYVTSEDGVHQLHADDGSESAVPIDIREPTLIELAAPMESSSNSDIVLAVGSQLSWLIQQVQRRSKRRAAREMILQYPEQQFGFRVICVPVNVANLVEEGFLQPLLDAFDTEIKKAGIPGGLVEGILDVLVDRN